MESIKTITIKDKTYQIQASVDDKGRVISETYLTKEQNQVNWEDVNNKPETITNIDQELLNKVDKDGDKVLSEQNFTTTLKNKLDGIEAQANKYEHPANHPASIITQDATHRFVTDTEKSTWNNKADAEDIPDISNLATKTELESKVDKELGKGLSEANYTETEKQKLSGIADNANNYVHPTTSGNKHIPAGGALGQILTFSEDGTAQWADTSTKLQEQFDTLNTAWEELQKEQQSLSKQVTELSSNVDLYSYGVEWDITVSSPILTRIGNPLLHKSLPIQSAYRGCVANNGVVNYYLYPDDWAYKEDGSTPSVLDGTDGTVRVHTPKFYGKSGSNGNKRWVRISLVKLDDSWVEIPELLIDAYRNTVDNTVLTIPKAVSVVNTTEAFRGGGNRAQFDKYLTTELGTKDAFRSDLGKPRTNVSRANMRTYATNAGSELLCYEYYKWIFYWNYVIEYANFNSQAAYNAELTADGYHQGGLGPGVTDWANAATSWSGYNATYPLTPCGYCNEFGNFTGVKDLVIPECTAQDGTNTVATHTFKVPRWRGFDNPFGDIWTNLDGVVIVRAAANEISTVYTTTNVSEFTDVVGEKTVAGYEVASDGYIKAFDLGETAEIIPSAVGGSVTTYICDYHYCNASSTALRTLLVGSLAANGGFAGLGCFYSSYGVGRAGSFVGFRTLNRVS